MYPSVLSLKYRRQVIPRHQDHVDLPVILNDYTNCLMGDHDEAKIEALLGAVAAFGAEYSVIDAGWYADDSNCRALGSVSEALPVGFWDAASKNPREGLDTKVCGSRQRCLEFAASLRSDC